MYFLAIPLKCKFGYWRGIACVGIVFVPLCFGLLMEALLVIVRLTVQFCAGEFWCRFVGKQRALVP